MRKKGGRKKENKEGRRIPAADNFNFSSLPEKCPFPGYVFF